MFFELMFKQLYRNADAISSRTSSSKSFRYMSLFRVVPGVDRCWFGFGEQIVGFEHVPCDSISPGSGTVVFFKADACVS